MTLGLDLGGVVTIVPLVLFASAARRLRLSTVGLLQYLSPSAQLLVAFLVFGESFTTTHAIAFPLIWLAISRYSLEAWLARDA